MASPARPIARKLPLAETLLIVAIVAVAAIGIYLLAGRGAGSSAAPSSAALAPVASGTPSTTPAVPSATPAVSAATTPFREFANHYLAATSAFSDANARLQSAKGDAAVVAGWDALGAWANAEAAWLTTHLPDPCYQATYDGWKKSIETEQEAVGLISAGYPNHNADLMAQGNAKARASVAYAEAMAATMAASAKACGVAGVTATPATAVPSGPMIVTGTGSQKTLPFSLAAGDYTVTVTGTYNGDGLNNVVIHLLGRADGFPYAFLFNKLPTSDYKYETAAYSLPTGEFYLDVLAPGDWALTFTPLK